LWQHGKVVLPQPVKGVENFAAEKKGKRKGHFNVFIPEKVAASPARKEEKKRFRPRKRGKRGMPAGEKTPVWSIGKKQMRPFRPVGEVPNCMYKPRGKGDTRKEVLLMKGLRKGQTV